MPSLPKILIIEDDQDLQMLLGDILSLAGYSVARAANGVEGLAMARSDPPSLILCDLLMPKMNGMEVLGALRSDQAIASIPLVFTSAKADMDTIDRAKDVGASGYLVKPFTRKELMECIRSRVPAVAQ
jgi:CheY-like chemotaxis protein